MKSNYEKERLQREKALRKRNQIIFLGLSLLIIISMLISLVKI